MAVDTPLAITAAGAGLTKVSVKTDASALLVTSPEFPPVRQRLVKDDYAICFSTDIDQTVAALITYVQAQGDSLHDLRVEGPSLEDRILLIPALSTVLHVLVVAAVIIVTAPVFFAAPLPANLPAFALVVLGTAVALSGLSVLIGVISPYARLTVLYAQAFFLPSMIIGGVMLPYSMLPDTAGRIARLLPATHAMNAFGGLAMGTGADFSPWGSLISLFADGEVAQTTLTVQAGDGTTETLTTDLYGLTSWRVTPDGNRDVIMTVYAVQTLAAQSLALFGLFAEELAQDELFARRQAPVVAQLPGPPAAKVWGWGPRLFLVGPLLAFAFYDGSRRRRRALVGLLFLGVVAFLQPITSPASIWMRYPYFFALSRHRPYYWYELVTPIDIQCYRFVTFPWMGGGILHPQSPAP